MVVDINLMSLFSIRICNFISLFKEGNIKQSHYYFNEVAIWPTKQNIWQGCFMLNRCDLYGR